MSDKWDIRFMRLAREISAWSKDPSRKIGALIVNDDRRILASGYNGFPRGIEDDNRLYDKETKNSLIIHAELNALLNALYNGISVKNSSLYVYGLPICDNCAKTIIQSGINRVVISYDSELSNSWTKKWEENSKPMLSETNIKISFIDLNQLGTI